MTVSKHVGEETRHQDFGGLLENHWLSEEITTFNQSKIMWMF